MPCPERERGAAGRVSGAGGWRSCVRKGGAADPFPFWARGREAPDGGTRGDAPQCFRGRLPPPPIWPETRFEEACLSKIELETSGQLRKEGCPVGSPSAITKRSTVEGGGVGLEMNFAA
jgi:hypothetical protein